MRSLWTTNQRFSLTMHTPRASYQSNLTAITITQTCCKHHHNKGFNLEISLLTWKHNDMLQKMILAENREYFSRHDFVIESSIPYLDAQLKGYTLKFLLIQLSWAKTVLKTTLKKNYMLACYLNLAQRKLIMIKYVKVQK